jgi:hypothetical protein
MMMRKIKKCLCHVSQLKPPRPVRRDSLILWSWVVGDYHFLLHITVLLYDGGIRDQEQPCRPLQHACLGRMTVSSGSGRCRKGQW